MTAEMQTVKSFAGSGGPTKIELALKDLKGGLADYRIWWTLAWNEIVQRYRRSTLGPLWVTVTMGVAALIFGGLFSLLFNHPLNRFLPYICASLPLWEYIKGCVQDGTTTFSANAGMITQIRRPLSMYVWHAIARNAIILAHSIVIFFLVAIPFQIYPNVNYVWLPLSFALVTINLGWLTLAVAIMSARFRDVPMIVQNALNILLWLTPVMYYGDQLSGRGQLITGLNPFTYLLELLRAPLMNEPMKLTSVMLVAAFAVIGWTVTLILFAPHARAHPLLAVNDDAHHT